MKYNMELLDIIILAFVQGITEWLPISSSGHLVIAEELLGISTPFYYNILLHVATLAVIFLIFWKDILKILKAFAERNWESKDGKLGIYIILGSIPTAIIGFTFHDTFQSFFADIRVVGFALIVTGILLFSTKFAKRKRSFRWYDSIFIGIAQGLAIIPGISRSGSTISTGLLLGLDKRQVTTFSFLLAVPAIIGASIFDFSAEPITGLMLFGLILTAIVGYISLKILLRLILQNKFHYFGWYCLTIGIIILAFT